MPAERAVTHLAAAVLLVAAVFAAFGPVRHHAFLNFDDNVYVTENPMVRQGLSAAGTRWAFTTTLGGHWHPLVWLSLMADVSLHGLTAGAFLLTNVAFHALAAVLLYSVLAGLTGLPARSGVVAALFALHPTRAESVAWVVERKDVLSGVFFMATLAAWLFYLRRPGPWRYLAVALAFTFGLLAKPMLVTLPVVLLLLDGWPLGRARFHRGDLRLVIEKAPLFLLALASGAVTLYGQGREGAIADALPVASRIANAAVGIAWYFGKAIWPTDLAIFYPLVPVGAARALAAAALLAAVTTAAVLLRRRAPYLLFGWAWFLVMLLPVAGLVQAGGQSVAVRFTYLPFVGLFVAAVWGVAEATAAWRWRRPILVTAAGLVLATSGVALAREVSFFQDSATLFRRALAVTGDNFMAHTNLGEALEQEGLFDEAGLHYAEAVRLNPTWPEAHNNRGTSLARRGEVAIAEWHFREALRRRPDFARAALNLAVALDDQGRVEEAEAAYARASALAPGDPAPREGRARMAWRAGNLYTRRGLREEAIAAHRRAIAAAPGWAAAHHHLGIALAAAGRLDEAVLSFEAALRLDPDLAGARENLAAVQASQ